MAHSARLSGGGMIPIVGSLAASVVLLALPHALQGTGNEARASVAAALSAPPPGRGYERVSPLDKNGSDVKSDERERATNRASITGDKIAFYTLAATDDQASGTPESQYLSTRDPDRGWITTGINPPLDPVPQYPLQAYFYAFTPDLSRSVLSTISEQLAPGAADPRNTFLRDNDDGSYQLMTAPTVPRTPADPLLTTRSREGFFEVGNSDFSHVVLYDTRKLIPDAPPEGGDQTNLYDWSSAGLRLLSVLPDGSPAPGTSYVGPPTNEGIQTSGTSAISSDGSRIYFGVNQGVSPLYVRENGLSTRLVSASEVAGDDPSVPHPGIFTVASASGSIAFFTSTDRLTGDAAAQGGRADLYRWDADAPAHERLTDITTLDATGAGVLGVAGASDTADIVYFVATGELDSDSEAQPGKPNLYVWRPGIGIHYVTTLDDTGASGFPADQGVWADQVRPTYQFYGGRRLTADGKHLLFYSYASLTDYPTGGHRELYLYDLDTDEIRCVSCSRATASSSGDASLVSLFFRTSFTTNYLRRNLSSDGKRAFFDSSEALVPEDTNGKVDVYSWENDDIQLISTGRSDDNSYFVDASPDGDDVFFTTRERLVRSDTDDLADLYDARVGGGFPEPEPVAPCEGEACRPAPTALPLLPVPGTNLFSGHGNETPGPRAALVVSRLSAAQRSKLARTGRITLSVRVNRPGKVTAVARARLQAGIRTVGMASASARRAGKLKLALRLSRTARDRLERMGSLRLSLSVRFAGARGSKSQSVVLRQAGAATEPRR